MKTRCSLLDSTVVGSICLLSGLFGSYEPARADTAGVPQLSSVFRINPADPEASVPSVQKQNAQPLEFGYFIQDLLALGAAAGRAGDHQAEARYYAAFAKAVPDDGAAFVKLCQAEEAAGHVDKAIAACRTALGLPGVELKDYVRFVHLVLGKAGDLSQQESEDVGAVIDNLRGTTETHLPGTVLQCELAMRNDNLESLRACTQELARLAPNDASTISFSWALAMRRRDRSEARQAIAQAKAAGIAAERVARMERATADLDWWRRLFGPRWTTAAASCVVAGSLAIALLLVVRRRRTVRAGLI